MRRNLARVGAVAVVAASAVIASAAAAHALQAGVRWN